MQRSAITVRGVVQGVGFRPFVFSLASRFQLRGFVRNHAGEVRIEVEGSPESIQRFLGELREAPPPLARITDLQCHQIPIRNEIEFRIESSEENRSAPVFVSPDIAPCDACLQELFDRENRRYLHPFLNCTNCGPRLTIIESVPYDRERTTMGRFPMCPKCQAEYDDPLDRRFHAQPIACPECGPRLIALTPKGETIATDDPLNFFVVQILQGKIGVLKGVGGFHFVCDARNEQSVRELRRRKHRNEKPFAIMVADVNLARVFCHVTAEESELLTSQRRPIVLLTTRNRSAGTEFPIAESVAPNNPELGVMLPCSPLHSLLMAMVGNVPLVMTSGNRSDEPIAYQDENVIEQLGTLADVILTHDRPIHVRCDDSVTRVILGDELPIRRSRGYAPEPISLPWGCPRPILAVGGQLKNVFALGNGRHAFLSHHIGDLDHYSAYLEFERDVKLYEDLFGVVPELIVHDLHPDYSSTGFAIQRAANDGIESLGVQHHHAHLASLMAEHNLDEPLIGVLFDGSGMGTDDAIWGGEFFVGDYGGFTRKNHFRYVRLPGGDHAVREPWRMGVAHGRDAGCDVSFPGISQQQTGLVKQMIEQGFNSPYTSSVGRLFDAVSALVGVRTHVSYEGQAAMELQWLATECDDPRLYPFDVSKPIDTRPLIQAVADDVKRCVPTPIIARRFHSTLVKIIVTVCQQIRSATGVNAVGLSGGVFLNSILTCETTLQLQAEEFRIYRHRLVPPSDGGLCLGQLAIAVHRLKNR
ncbi:MAG: carbamoyltransferase HypF [Planctomycetaceae bacterium]|nr:carbamoyltransferase HypF [Planctomycetaceae bacterium]